MAKNVYAASGRPPIEDITQHRWWKLGLRTESGRAPTVSTADTMLCWLWTFTAKQVIHMGVKTSVRRMLWLEFRPDIELDETAVVVPGESCSPDCANPWHCEQMNAGEYRRWLWAGKREDRVARIDRMPEGSTDPCDLEFWDKLDNFKTTVRRSADAIFTMLWSLYADGTYEGSFYNENTNVFNWHKHEAWRHYRADVTAEIERMWKAAVADSGATYDEARKRHRSIGK